LKKQRGDRHGGKYNHWWDFSSIGRRAWFLISGILVLSLSLALWESIYSSTSSQRGTEGTEDLAVSTTETAVEGLTEDILSFSAEASLLQWTEARIDFLFSDLAGPAADAYINILSQPAFLVSTCVFSEGLDEGLELPRRLRTVSDFLVDQRLEVDGFGSDEAMDVFQDFVVRSETLQVIDRQLTELCVYPAWIGVVQFILVLVASAFALLRINGGVLARLSFASVASVSAGVMGLWFAYLVAAGVDRRNWKDEIRGALESDEAVLLDLVRAGLGSPLGD
jgi:hypothetical protein